MVLYVEKLRSREAYFIDGSPEVLSEVLYELSLKLLMRKGLN